MRMTGLPSLTGRPPAALLPWRAPQSDENNDNNNNNNDNNSNNMANVQTKNL